MQVESKPPFCIFLDIDGVLFNSTILRNLPRDHPLRDEARKVAEQFSAYLKENDSNAYSNNFRSIVNAQYFPLQPLNILDRLIERVKAVAEPQIVLSSRWRERRSVAELQTMYFSKHNFSKYLTDKTIELCPGEKYPNKRLEIREWLDRHPDIQHYVIFDDEDRGLSEEFGRKFIFVNYDSLLQEQHMGMALQANTLTRNLPDESTFET